MKRWGWILLFALLAAPASAEHAWLTWDGEPLPANPEQPVRGSFNRSEAPSLDRLSEFRAHQLQMDQRAHELRAAGLSAPSLNVVVRPTTIFIQEGREKRHHSDRRWAR